MVNSSNAAAPIVCFKAEGSISLLSRQAMPQRDSPIGQRLQPFRLILAYHTHKLISLFGGVIEKDHMISTRNGDGDILQTPRIPPPDICFWNVVTSHQHTVGDTGQVDLDRLCADIDEHNFKSQLRASSIICR